MNPIYQGFEKPQWGINSSGMIYRIKNGETTIYSIGSQIGSGGTSFIHDLIPQKGKIKAVKISNGIHELTKENIRLSKLPKGKIGVKFYAKAFFAKGVLGFKEQSMIIMSKYDESLGSYSYLKKMTTEQKLDMIKQLVSGLAALHEVNICHCDINVSNILYKVKKSGTRYDFADFGFSYLVGLDGGDLNEDYYQNRIETLKLMDISSLGMLFKIVIFGPAWYKKVDISEEEMIEKNLPSKLGEILNFMCNTNMNLAAAKKMEKIQEKIENI